MTQKKPKYSERKLNTKSCCLLCLTAQEDGGEESSDSSSTSAVSLKLLSRYLKISSLEEKEDGPLHIGGETTTETESLSSSSTTTILRRENCSNLKADLCTTCSRMISKLTKLFLSLEKIQMEVSFWLGRVHHQISEATKNPKLVQNYSEKMTSDPETLTQLQFVDDLRKEIALKSLLKQSEARPAAEAKVKVKPLHQKDIEELLQLPDHQNNDKEPPLLQPEPGEEPEVAVADQDQPPQVDFLLKYEYDEEVGGEVFNKDAISEEASISMIDEEINPKETEADPDYLPSPSTARSRSASSRKKASSTSKNKLYRKNSKTGAFHCLACNKAFRLPYKASRHYNEVHLHYRKYECEVCGKRYDKRKLLLSHQTNNKCKGPAFKLQPWEIQIRPSKGSRTTLNPATGKFECSKSECSEAFDTRNDAYRHYHLAHLPRKEWKCEICNSSVFKHKESLRNHMKTCERNLQRRLEDPNYNKFQCWKCPKSFKTEQNMKLHLENIHSKKNRKVFNCELCEKTFNYPGSVQLHKNSVHFGVNFECEICGKQFKYKTCLQRHQRLRDCGGNQNQQHQQQQQLKVEADNLIN